MFRISDTFEKVIPDARVSMKLSYTPPGYYLLYSFSSKCAGSIGVRRLWQVQLAKSEKHYVLPKKH